MIADQRHWVLLGAGCERSSSQLQRLEQFCKGRWFPDLSRQSAWSFSHFFYIIPAPLSHILEFYHVALGEVHLMVVLKKSTKEDLFILLFRKPSGSCIHTYRHTQTHIYDWCSLFVVLGLCKVTTNTELMNTESLLLGEYRVRFLEPQVMTFLSTDQYITLCYACFSLKTPYPIYILLIH